MSWQQKDLTTDETVGVGRAHRGLLDVSIQISFWTGTDGPLDFNSAVHRCNSSATSSGSTRVRTQASDH
jgi:hypothetical protein